MKLARFIVDSHIHAQRFSMSEAFKAKVGRRIKAGKVVSYNDLAEEIETAEPYANTERLRFDMECYGVDMCILLPAFGMTNELNLAIVDANPGRFAAVCAATETARKATAGEQEWSAEAAAAEIDALLATGKFAGIGEGLPANRERRSRSIGQPERLEEMRPVMEVARKHKSVVRIHSGVVMGYPLSHHFWPETLHPLWLLDIAEEYPDVPILLDHGGVQGWWTTRFVEEAMLVAAANDNVYLATGLWWPELYETALSDSNIGADKLLWGCDWGASIPFHTRSKGSPSVYAVQKRGENPPAHQVDVWGWSLRQLLRLDIDQDDLNLILGGNAARLFGLPLPHSRLFRPVRSELVPQPGERATAWVGEAP